MPSKKIRIIVLASLTALCGVLPTALTPAVQSSNAKMDAIDATTNEGIQLLKQGRYPEGEQLLSNALKMAKTANPNAPRLPGMMSNLALAYSDQGKLDQAEDLFKQAIVLFEKQHDKTGVRAKVEDNLGQLYLRQDKLEQAGKHLITARELFKQAGVLSSPPAAMNLDNLSRYYKAIGKLPEAVSMCQEALSLMQKEMGSNNPDVIVALLNLADIKSAQKNYSESDKLYRQAAVVIERTYAPDQPEALRSAAQMLTKANRPSEASHLLSLAEDIEKGVVPEAKSHTQAVKEPIAPVQDIKSETDFELWSTYYYLYPRPDLTVKALLFAEKDGIFDMKNAQLSLVALTSQLFRQNPKQLTVWIKGLTPLATEHKKLIWRALWQANTADCKKEANLFAQQFPTYDRPPVLTQSSPQPPLIENMPLSADVLDMLWASFFITGDERYVERIVSALRGQGQYDANKTLTAGAATWSLTANAHQHKRVMKICQASLQKYPECKPELEQIIARANAPEK